VLGRGGFAFSLEAAFSILLAVMALAFLPAFAAQHEEAGEYLACADAARALSRTNAFASQEKLQAAVEEAGGLLGMCIETEVQGGGMTAGACGRCRGSDGRAGACANAGSETVSFSIPVWSGGRLRNASVSCGREA
jgi:hypothetical protein